FDPKKRLAKVDELSAELSAALELQSEELAALPPPPPAGKKATKPLPTTAEPLTPTTPEGKVTPPPAEPAKRKSARHETAEATNPRATPPPPDGAQPAEGAPAPAPPTPPAVPAVDLTPATFHAPPNVHAWMHSAPQPTSNVPARWLALIDVP